MYERLGGIVRLLHDSLRELGYDKALTEASSQITDAQDRLEYVATLTEQAANKVLNTLDDGMPAQDKLSKQAKDMEGRWADLFAGKLSLDEFKALAGDSRLRAGRVGSDRSRKGAPARDHDGPGLPGHHRPADQEGGQDHQDRRERTGPAAARQRAAEVKEKLAQKQAARRNRKSRPI
jgi:hypothetical protein